MSTNAYSEVAQTQATRTNKRKTTPDNKYVVITPGNALLNPSSYMPMMFHLLSFRELGINDLGSALPTFHYSAVTDTHTGMYTSQHYGSPTIKEELRPKR
jgi:hypothetical protein